MDYVFIEADDRGEPISQNLLIETWDMPLPEPKLKARVNGRRIRLEIIQDAWLEVGKTTFEISNPRINITSATITGDRTAEIECDSEELVGLTITFEMKNLFYYHRASTQVEQE